MTEKGTTKKAPAPEREGIEISPSAILKPAAKRRKKVASKVLCAASGKEQARAVAEVGARMRMARELNGWEVLEAARRLGFENGSSLSRFEHAKHVSGIPLYIIARAAQVYGVSTDFLHGLTDDLSISPALRMRRDMAVWLAGEMQQARERDISAMLLLQEQVELIFSGMKEITLAVEGLSEAITYLRDRRVVTFENMPGSSTVMYRSQHALKVATATSAKLARFSSMLRAGDVRMYGAPASAQLPLDYMAEGEGR